MVLENALVTPLVDRERVSRWVIATLANVGVRSRPDFEAAFQAEGRNAVSGRRTPVRCLLG